MSVNIDIGVVLLGAGASSRMGRPKLLLPWGDTTIAGHLIAQWQSLGARQIAVVHRPHDESLLAELVRNHFQLSNCIENPRPDDGMFSSVQCAARWPGWRPGLTHWAIVLGDQPHLKPETLRLLLAEVARHPGAVCQPAFEGKAKHPVVLPLPVFRELAAATEKNLKLFLERPVCLSVKCSIPDPGLSLDLDTPEDYKRALLSVAL
ncbi:MAG TPA: nucleotidyltransferase family protein [Verrucomicrobiae bacterium]|nr:nucleotidyltransferase family protein [Verrucomicrobiae bacterium]